TDQADTGDRVSLMKLHAAQGLEFDVVFLPGWEEGLFPHQRSLDENGQAGQEEERRHAYVGLTRARRHVQVSFAQNRRMRGLYQAAVPSRFVDELPPQHVEVVEAPSRFGGAYSAFDRMANPYGRSRFDDVGSFQTNYQTPGWQRAQQRWQQGHQPKRGPVVIEGELVASSTGQPSSYNVGERVFHQKF